MNAEEVLQAVHRTSDGELVGYLSAATRTGEPGWVARTLFGGELGVFATRPDAVRYLQARGLPLLAEKWWYWSEHQGRWLLTFLVEARLGAVLVRFGYDPGNTATLRGPDLDKLALGPLAPQAPPPVTTI